MTAPYAAGQELTPAVALGVERLLGVGERLGEAALGPARRAAAQARGRERHHRSLRARVRHRRGQHAVVPGQLVAGLQRHADRRTSTVPPAPWSPSAASPASARRASARTSSRGSPRSAACRQRVASSARCAGLVAPARRRGDRPARARQQRGAPAPGRARRARPPRPAPARRRRRRRPRAPAASSKRSQRVRVAPGRGQRAAEREQRLRAIAPVARDGERLLQAPTALGRPVAASLRPSWRSSAARAAGRGRLLQRPAQVARRRLRRAERQRAARRRAEHVDDPRPRRCRGSAAGGRRRARARCPRRAGSRRRAGAAPRARPCRRRRTPRRPAAGGRSAARPASTGRRMSDAASASAAAATRSGSRPVSAATWRRCASSPSTATRGRPGGVVGQAHEPHGDRAQHGLRRERADPRGVLRGRLPALRLDGADELARAGRRCPPSSASRRRRTPRRRGAARAATIRRAPSRESARGRTRRLETCAAIWPSRSSGAPGSPSRRATTIDTAISSRRCSR